MGLREEIQGPEALQPPAMLEEPGKRVRPGVGFAADEEGFLNGQALQDIHDREEVAAQAVTGGIENPPEGGAPP